MNVNISLLTAQEISGGRCGDEDDMRLIKIMREMRLG